MSSFLLRFGLALPLLGLWACSSTTPDPVSTAGADNAVAIKTYLSTRPALAGIKTSNSGLYYLIRTPIPTAKSPGLGEEVSFNFKSYNLQDVLVDSTTVPVYYPFGLSLLLFGLEEGLSYMHEGEKATLIMPSELAYGSRASTNLPAYSPVRFEVTLLRSLTEGQQITRYLRDNKLTLTDSTATGLRIIKTLSNPAGNAVVTGQTVNVRYSGTLLRDPKVFDSGTFTLVLGTTSVIAGFEEAVRKLRVGEKATVIIPSAIGYGTKGSVNGNNQYVVTPYAPMVFTLEVVSAQ
jgi:FKBP-type peptidyl-prolyl cis-trans isomerase